MITILDDDSATGAARIHYAGKDWIRTADLLYVFHPEDKNRSSYGALYRDYNPGACKLFERSELKQWGYYIPEDRADHFARFVNDQPNMDHANRRGQAIGASKKNKRLLEELADRNKLLVQIVELTQQVAERDAMIAELTRSRGVLGDSLKNGLKKRKLIVRVPAARRVAA